MAVGLDGFDTPWNVKGTFVDAQGTIILTISLPQASPVEMTVNGKVYKRHVADQDGQAVVYHEELS